MGKHRYKTVAVVGGLIIGIVIFSLSAIGKKYAATDPHPQKRQTATYIPEIVSCVKKVKVVKTEIADAGTPNENLVIQIENSSDIGIIAISIESANDEMAFENTLRTSFDPDKPEQVVIKPHEVGTLNTAMTSVLAGVPLRIGAAMYADGSEEGCDRGLKTLHGLRDREKANRKGTIK